MTRTPEERAADAITVADAATATATPTGAPTARDSIAPEEVLESERGSLVTGMVIARAWRDAEFRERLRNTPEQVLRAAGLDLPGTVQVRVFEDTQTIRHIALTSLTTEPDELLALVREGGALSGLLPLREGSEVRLVQHTEQALCLVVPLGPAEPELLTDVDVLRGLAPRAAVFAGGDVVQSMVEASAASEAALEAAAQASAVASTSVQSNTNQVTNVNVYTQTGVDAAAQAEAAVSTVEAQTVATTATAAAEAEAATVTVTAATVVLT